MEMFGFIGNETECENFVSILYLGIVTIEKIYTSHIETDTIIKRISNAHVTYIKKFKV